MSYDEFAMRELVEQRTFWAVAKAYDALAACHSAGDDIAIARLAAEMLRQLPMVVPETPNDE